MPLNEERYLHCPRVARAVSVRQSEGQCRDRHGCEAGDCPLEQKFQSLGDGLVGEAIRARCEAVLGLVGGAARVT